MSSCEPKYTDTDYPTDAAASNNLRNFSSHVIIVCFVICFVVCFGVRFVVCGT